MLFNISDLRKKPEGISFEENLFLKEDLQAREAGILDLSEVTVKGHISYDEGFFVLTYHLSYRIVLTSSRSMEPVERWEAYPVTEIFVAAEDLVKLEEDAKTALALIVEGDSVNLSESVSDNILLNIPLKVLTAEEEGGADLPQGKDWQVMTEEAYAEEIAQKKAEQSPFAGLSTLLDDED